MREVGIGIAFAVLCGLAVWSVVLPELEDQGETLAASPGGPGAADAGTAPSAE
ncbi:MAG: hypothetical protein OXU20_24425 [Myxococcales bacterium]|nr:hypothetical protein [Myxococcales bacterium]MDD9969659.1 hypothetical protein [Myxococcales bacterium]